MLVTTIIVLIVFLTLFILYPLAILLVDAVVGESGPTLSVFQRVLAMPSFETAISNTLVLGLFVGIVATLIGLLFAYVEVYVNLKSRFMSGLFKLVSMLPVVSPPFVLSLSVILLFGKAGLITRTLLGIYDNNVYGFWGIALVQTLTFFPVCYMMFRGLLRNIDPSLERLRATWAPLAGRSSPASHCRSSCRAWATRFSSPSWSPSPILRTP